MDNDGAYEWEYHNPVLNRDFLITDQIVKWTDGRKVRFELFIDITEQKEKEKSLRKSEERLKLAQKAADIGTWDWDIKNDEIIWSDEIKSFFGLTKRTLDNKYKTFLNYVHPDDRPYVVQAIDSALKHDEDYLIEHRIVTDDGSIRWLRQSGDVMRDRNGNAIRMIGISQEITDQKKLEEKIINIYLKLDQESRRLKTVMDNAPEGIIITDKKARIIFFNKAAERLYNHPIPVGKKYQSHSSLNILDVDGSKISPRQLPLTRSALEGETIKGKELVIKWPDDQIRYVIVNTAPIKNDNDQIVGAVGMLQDITDRKEIEEKIKDLNTHLLRQTAELSSVNEELEAFSYSVSHDLRSPLRSIDGFSQAIVEDYGDLLDKEGKDYLHRIRNASQRMGELIDGLLKLSRITRHNIEYKTIDLSQLSHSIISWLQQKNPERDVQMSIQDDLHVKGDERLIGIALENLITNAWKFTSKKDKTMIEIGEEKKDGSSVFFIRDNGAGFNMDYAEKLFVPFQRLHTSDEYEGTGIGLGIVKRVFNRHGGKIWAESEEGNGTTFYFTLDKNYKEVTK